MDVDAEDTIDDRIDPDEPAPPTPATAAIALATWVVAYGVFWGVLVLFTSTYNEIFNNMGVALPFITKLALNTGNLVRKFFLLTGPLLVCAGGISLIPFIRAQDKRRVAPPYFVGAIVLLLGAGVTFLSLQLPIWEMHRALGK